MANELKTCAHCKGVAELDYEQPFCAFPSGKMEKQVAIYCTKCDVHMSMCYSDFPEYDHDQMAAILTEKWNTRPAAPVEGLKRYGTEYNGGLAWDITKKEDGEYVRFDQAEAIIAAEREKTERWHKKAMDAGVIVHSDGTTSHPMRKERDDLKADNAALTARVKELETDCSAYILSAADQDKRRKALETQLVAARKELGEVKAIAWQRETLPRESASKDAQRGNAIALSGRLGQIFSKCRAALEAKP